MTLSRLVRPTALLISVAASVNHPVLGPGYRGIVDGLELARGSSWDRLGDIADLAAQLAGDPARRQRVERLLRVADLGISRIEARKLPPQTPDRDRYAPRLVHDGDGQEYALPIDAESGGTLLWLQLVAAALRTLNSGSALLLDEIGASLHPVLTGELVRLFKDPQANPTGAQLIFTSHDTALLGHLLGDVLAREEIRFESSSGPTSRTTGRTTRPGVSSTGFRIPNTDVPARDSACAAPTPANPGRRVGQLVRAMRGETAGRWTPGRG